MDEEIQAKLRELADDSRKLRAALAQRPSADEASKEALQHLSQGDLANAEARLRAALDKNIEARDFRAAAARADELGELKALQLESLQAKHYLDLANQLRGKSTDTTGNQPKPTPRLSTSPVQYPGVRLVGLIGSSIQWSTGWLDLAGATDFSKGDRLRLTIDGRQRGFWYGYFQGASLLIHP